MGQMKIGIIGATGNAGRCFVRGGEEVARGHGDGTGPARARALFGPDVTVLAKDAFALVSDDLRGGRCCYRRLLRSAGSGLPAPRPCRSARFTSARHAGSQAWIATRENQLKELRFLQGADNVNWVAVSPSQTFARGEATGFVR